MESIGNRQIKIKNQDICDSWRILLKKKDVKKNDNPRKRGNWDNLLNWNSRRRRRFGGQTKGGKRSIAYKHLSRNTSRREIRNVNYSAFNYDCNSTPHKWDLILLTRDETFKLRFDLDHIIKYPLKFIEIGSYS